MRCVDNDRYFVEATSLFVTSTRRDERRLYHILAVHLSLRSRLQSSPGFCALYLYCLLSSWVASPVTNDLKSSNHLTNGEEADDFCGDNSACDQRLVVNVSEAAED